MLKNNHTYLCSRRLFSHCPMQFMPGLLAPNFEYPFGFKSSSLVSDPLETSWFSIDREKLRGFRLSRFSVDEEALMCGVVTGAVVKLFDLRVFSEFVTRWQWPVLVPAAQKQLSRKGGTVKKSVTIGKGGGGASKAIWVFDLSLSSQSKSRISVPFFENEMWWSSSEVLLVVDGATIG